MNRDMLSRRLQRRGFTTLIATDGAQGLEMARAERPDLVIMDMGLPVLDGWEVTRRLKASDETKGIPVIALTADALKGDREKALTAGCDEFATKPVDFTRLLTKMESLLNLRGE